MKLSLDHSGPAVIKRRLSSIFFLAFQVLGRSRGTDGDSSFTLTAKDVRDALELTLDKTDTTLDLVYGPEDREDLDPPGLIVPKLCLLCAVIEHTSISSLTFHRAVGSCAGIMVSPDFFP